MDSIHLTPRLQCIADLVPLGSRLCDVGTDHGYLPLYLLLEHKISAAIASDLRSGPLSTAKSNSARYDVDSIVFRLCNGLEGILEGEVDTVTIAGLGGDTMVSILSASGWSLNDVTLILQPMTKPEIIRRWLIENGIGISSERLIEDAGKIYSVFVARRGKTAEYSQGEFFTGRYSQIRNQSLACPWLEMWISKAKTAIEGMEKSSINNDRLQTERELLKEWSQAYLSFQNNFLY